MIGTILGILGIVITLIFGGYSIWAYKKNKRNVSLEFLNKECYSLFRDDVNRLNIDLIYNKKPLNNTLILLKAKLANNGQIDIDKNRVYSPLKIITTDDYRWLESNIASKPEGSQVSISIQNDNQIQLDWDLLKKNEQIEIEGLVEIKNSETSDGEKGIEFYNSLSFDYRITDLNSVQKEKQISRNLRRRMFSRRLNDTAAITAILLGVLFISFEFIPKIDFMKKEIVKYNLHKGENESIASLIPSKSDMIKITIDDIEEAKELTVEEFNNSYKIKKIENISPDPNGSLFNRTLGIIYFVMGLLLVLMNLYRKKKAANKV